MSLFEFYKEHKVNKLLSPYIDCVWMENYTQLPDVKGKTLRIVPDNTIELIFTEGKMTRSLSQDTEPEILKSHLAGLKTRPQKICVEGRIILAVRFKPTAFRFLSDINLAETIDASLEPVDVFGKSIIDLEERIAETSSPQAQVKIVESYFINNIYKLDRKPNLLFNFILKQIHAFKGNVKISSLSEKTGYCIKTVERNFISDLGITPAKYAKLLRFINAVNQITKVDLNYSPDWNSIAYCSGYYDQNHFIKDVKRFAGLTPQKYFSTNRDLQLPVFSKSQEMSISSYS